MTNTDPPDFGILDEGQLFRFENRLYRKHDQRTAILIGDVDGEPIADQTTHTFYPEDLVEIAAEPK